MDFVALRLLGWDQIRVRFRLFDTSISLSDFLWIKLLPLGLGTSPVCFSKFISTSNV